MFSFLRSFKMDGEIKEVMPAVSVERTQEGQANSANLLQVSSQDE